MTDLDYEQVNKFIHSITEKIIEGRFDDDDARNMLNMIVSLNAELVEMRKANSSKLKMISNFMETRR